MSKAREKDTGKFSPQTSMTSHPGVERLDLTSEGSRPIASNFHRNLLDQTTGRARQNTASIQPTVDSGD